MSETVMKTSKHKTTQHGAIYGSLRDQSYEKRISIRQPYPEKSVEMIVKKRLRYP